MKGTLLQEFILQAERFPERTALLLDDGRLHEMSYEELAYRAEAIAEKLRAGGLKVGDNVAVSLKRGVDLIAGVLGILWAGGAYVPISLEQPMERRVRIYQQAGIRYCLTEKGSSAAEYTDCYNICVEDCVEKTEQKVQFDTAYMAGTEETAYIIFTSGSTGVPKGVEIAHGAAWNTIADILEKFQFTEADCALAVSAIDFDLSVFDIFGMLSIGGRLVLLDEDIKKEPEEWIYRINQYGVTIWNSVPALFEMLLYTLNEDEILPSLRLALLSGDWIKPAIYEAICKHCTNCRMIALGGATEASIWSNFYEVTGIYPEWNAIPYGRELTNQKFRVVIDGQDAPTGEIGELWIGGAGLAKGYVGDPELTDKAFVIEQGERWYRTGDLGYRQPDGIMIFMGRMDQQVKVNGFRIELGEVESKLTEIEQIKSATAIVKKHQAATTLVAALQPKDAGKRNTSTPVITKEDGPETDSWGIAVEYEVKKFICDVLRMQPEISAECVPETVKGAWELWQQLKADGVPEQEHANITLRKILQQRVTKYRAIFLGEEAPQVLLDDEQLAPASIIARSKENKKALEYLAQEIEEQIKRNEKEKLVIGLLYGRNGELFLPLLEKLEAYGSRIKVIFLESSDGLLREAKENFWDYVLDIEYQKIKYPYVKQEIAGSLDALVVVNGIHTFANMKRGLSFLQILLREDGQLYGVESTEMSPLGWITAAVLENGFKDYEENRRNAHSSMLTSAQWCDCLRDAGYEKIHGKEWMLSKLFLFVATNGAEVVPKKELLEKHCRQKLVSYMVPQKICYTAEWPLTGNGKVDRKKILEWFEIEDEEEGVEPQTYTEKQIASIWMQLLARPKIYQHQNFFELGGDSLLLTRMLASLRNQFGVQISMRQIFERPTLMEVAAIIDSMVAETEFEEGEL